MASDTDEKLAEQVYRVDNIEQRAQSHSPTSPSSPTKREELRQTQIFGGKEQTLLPGRLYYARVQAISEVAISEWSPISEPVRSPPDLPDKIVSMDVAAKSAHTITFEWRCPIGNGDPVKLFYLRHWVGDWPESVVADNAPFDSEKKGKHKQRSSLMQTPSTGTMSVPDSVPSSRPGSAYQGSCASPDLRLTSGSPDLITDSRPGSASPMTSGFDPHRPATPGSRRGSGELSTPTNKQLEPIASFDNGIGIPSKESSQNDVGVAKPSKKQPVPRPEKEKKALKQEEVEVVEDSGTETYLCRWTWTGLEPGQLYRAEVTPVNCVGACPEWVLSPLARTDFVIPTEPWKLQGVEGAQSHNEVSFAWEPPEYSGGDEIRDYEVRWIVVRFHEIADGFHSMPTVDDVLSKPLDGEVSGVAKLGPEARSYQVCGLRPGDAAVPIVRAFNSVGFSPWSALPPLESWVEGGPLRSKPLPPAIMVQEEDDQGNPVGPPVVTLEEVPTRTADGRPTHTLTARWQCPAPNGQVIQAFEVQVSRADSGTKARISFLSKAAEVEKPSYCCLESNGKKWAEGEELSLPNLDKNLTPGALYTIKLRAKSTLGDAQGWSPASNAARAPPAPPLKPGPPEDIHRWPQAIQVAYAEPCMNGSAFTNCNVRYSTSPDLKNASEVKVRGSPDINAKEIMATGLMVHTEYFFQVRVSNAMGWSPWSESSKGILTMATRPQQPAMPSAKAINMEELRVSWPAPDDHGSKLTSYDLLFGDGVSSSDLGEQVEHANSGCCEEERLNSIEVVGPLKLISIDAQSVTNFKTPDYLFENLLPAHVYSLAVRAHNDIGSSDWSPVLGDIKMPAGPPSKCPPLILQEATQTALRVIYTMPYNCGEPITSFEVSWERVWGPADFHISRRSVAGSGVEQEKEAQSANMDIPLPTPPPEAAPPYGTGGKAEALIVGLKPGTEYDLKVRAKNSCGLGGFSNAVRMITMPGRPDAPGRMCHVSHEQETMDSPVTENWASPVIHFTKSQRIQDGQVLSSEPVVQSSQKKTSILTFASTAVQEMLANGGGSRKVAPAPPS
eukprot:gnl/TRDRNA2_/TRDRNA2_146177_c5_seq1.p1 gnl/TRDRNA2_/TRDRNA2_146177_c5~~gnl/TRDRNA2_/TRDRNA2_146177_c5_seq1.p1  ORF type:complete len:1217 (-),score=208.67 gnl/TRDRNA2_/TRDRNA2_146177_c5_seq1:83-3277(-)